MYLGIQNGQLRYFEPKAQWIPTPEEDAAKAHQLAEQLRSLGVEPED